MLQSSFELPKLISYEVMYEVSGILSTWNKLAAPVFTQQRLNLFCWELWYTSLHSTTKSTLLL